MRLAATSRLLQSLEPEIELEVNGFSVWKNCGKAAKEGFSSNVEKLWKRPNEVYLSAI